MNVQNRCLRYLPAALAAGALVLMAGAPCAADELFVFMGPDIRGESSDLEHADWIRAIALTHAFDVPCTVGAGAGILCGPPNLADVSFLKPTDSASVALHAAAAQGSVIGVTVVLELCRSIGANPQACYYRIELEEVRITNIDLAGSCGADGTCVGSVASTESVSLGFVRILWRYTFFDANGDPVGAPAQACWDGVGEC